MIRSLRNRLLIGYLLGMALLMAVSGWSIHRRVETTETREFDENLLQFTHRVALIAELEQDEVTFEWEQLGDRIDMEPDPEDAHDGGGYLFTIEDEQSHVLASNVDVIPGMRRLEPSWSAQPRFRGYHLPDGSHVREVSYRFRVRLDDDEPGGIDAPMLAITMLRRTTEIDAMLSHMRLIFVSVGVPIVLISALGVYLLLRLSLRDLKPLRSQLHHLAVGDLGQTIRPGTLPSEFLPLIDSINRLTHGLNQRIAREKYFVATAAHELRTPVATVLSNLELALAEDIDMQAHADHPVARAYNVSRYMKEVIQRLLQLTRLENTNEPSERIAIEPVGFITDVIEQFEARMRGRDVRIKWTPLPGANVVIDADPVLFSLVVSNLISNMASHTQAHETASITLTRDQNRVRLDFKNPASLEDVADISCVTEPFWRADATRNLRDQHAGLGLAIASTAAHRMGAALSFEVIDDRLFVATLTMPRVGSEDSPAARQAFTDK